MFGVFSRRRQSLEDECQELQLRVQVLERELASEHLVSERQAELLSAFKQQLADATIAEQALRARVVELSRALTDALHVARGDGREARSLEDQLTLREAREMLEDNT